MAIIPARLESSRFPGKVLCDLAGKPMLQWVFERVKQARCLAQVYIATDAPKVEAVCSRFTANIIRTSPNHLC
ncbi:MAG: NTP transferase domain-containing protein, partial [Bacteroidetes bacterium]|nr:NTP transferase domain-containing protein [Bacteroidota bacterium]